MESSDYKGSENSLSFICFESKAHSIENNTVNTIINAKEVKKEIEPDKDVSHYLNDFINQFKVEQNDFDYPSNGLFGYISYDSVSILIVYLSQIQKKLISQIYYMMLLNM